MTTSSSGSSTPSEDDCSRLRHQCRHSLHRAIDSAHLPLRRQCAGREVALTTHSLAEAYSVLTRLPGDARVTPTDAARLLAANFPQTVGPDPAVASNLPEVLAPLGIAGGAVYDALVALAALGHQMVLLTRDARALCTYAAIGVRIEMAKG